MTNKPKNSLVDDLYHILQYEVHFSGKIAVSMIFPACPNPGLDVDGIGRIPLPLTEHTAEKIASVGDQAPYGRGADTIVDTTVRDTIQIDASNIRFKNPKWAPALQEWVEKKIWTGLGCAPFTSPPKCEPYKLLLYKPGAHFLPHQDTEKASGMFATLIVVLPSEFTGGEIHVSHGDKSMVFDNAKDSEFETTTLAWYTDVTHEVKEITSGYRLALSYHLINTSSGISPPHLPSGDSSLQHLRQVLSRWSNNEYPPLKLNQAVAYLFSHKYSPTSLRELILKGNDQHVASILKHACDAEGAVALVGWLNLHVEGCTASDSWQVYGGDGEAPEYGPHRGTEGNPVMSHVFETKVWVDKIRDMQGKRIGISKIELDRGSLLPYKSFSGVYPEESKLGEGYYGNEGADVEFMYRYTAMVIFPKDKQLSLMLSSAGDQWALEELEKSKAEGPSKENCEIINFLAQLQSKDITVTISKIAIEWHDAVVWGQIVESHPEFFLEQKGYANLCDGWQEFDFDGVRPTFEKLFQGRNRLPFLLFVKGKLPFGADPQKDEWISAQATRMMEAFAPDRDRRMIEACVDIVRWRGLCFASSTVLPRFLQARVELDDMIGFALGLIKNREELIALPESEGQAARNAEILDHILDKILAATIPKVSPMSWSHSPSSVSSVLSICIPGKRMKPYGDLLNSIAGPGRDKESFYTRYLNFYAGIIPKLVELLGEGGISVSSPPSREFFRNIIETYLKEILGSKEGSTYLKFSMLACGHETCSKVNDFLQSEETKTEIQTDRATDRCLDDLKIGGRHPVLKLETQYHKKGCPRKLTKTHEAEAARHWSVRLADTRKLLNSIGTEDEVSRIMGERYRDVERALEGSQAFETAGAQGGIEADDAMVGIE